MVQRFYPASGCSCVVVYERHRSGRILPAKTYQVLLPTKVLVTKPLTGHLEFRYYQSGTFPEDGSRSRNMNIFAIILIVLLILLGLVYFVAIGFWLVTRANTEIAQSIWAYGPWTIGLPFAALGSFALVTLLPAVSGSPLEFSGFGFEFKGSSSQIAFWVLCYFVIALTIRIADPRSPKGSNLAPADKSPRQDDQGIVGR
jgi:hypothetical protein